MGMDQVCGDCSFMRGDVILSVNECAGNKMKMKISLLRRTSEVLPEYEDKEISLATIPVACGIDFFCGRIPS